jgi:hypothetical protein
MPGGSPSFRTAQAIERLYETLEITFEELSVWCQGLTLNEFHARMSSKVAVTARHAGVVEAVA